MRSIVLAQDVENAPHLRHRLPGGASNGLEMGTRAFRIAIEQFLGGAGVHRDDRDAVSDDVVQLASNPGPLIGDGRARELLRIGVGELCLLGTVQDQPTRAPSPEDKEDEDRDVAGAGAAAAVVLGLERVEHRADQDEPPATAHGSRRS